MSYKFKLCGKISKLFVGTMYLVHMYMYKYVVSVDVANYGHILVTIQLDLPTAFHRIIEKLYKLN